MKNYFKRSSVKPGGNEIEICSEIMARIDDLAPSDAKVFALISRLSDGSYLTRIPVFATDNRFADGRFFVEAKKKSMLSSLKAAQIEVLRLLREWKENRF